MTNQAIRDAVHDGNHLRAAELFVEWAQRLPLDENGLREIADLARWTREMVLCARAHGEARIQELRGELHAASAYSRQADALDRVVQAS